MTINLTSQQRERAIEILTPELEAITDRLRDLAAEAAPESDLPDELMSLWLVELTRQGMRSVRDREAARAELAGYKQADLAVAVECGGAGHYRQRCVDARRFADAQRAADLSGVTIPMPSGDWVFEVAPQVS